MEIIKWDAGVQGRMTSVAFLESCIEDISKEDMEKIISAGGFSLNNQVINSLQNPVEFKTGDTVMFYQDIFKGNKTCLQFTLVSNQ